ncbi:hypothetical protein K504DRAFT_133743 [Pleomassaria siparia CBS 279.74]|uniref:Uncharacterized protein n=1 Tax=Pleomassaria siparia CBS 279.74 TaxID=1314801 RepID=A0A6G1KK69_9PLEO|nr:hypothetical protein K504DRAFT_133743 [Pleomassaria siparia CBS 279.74]
MNYAFQIVSPSTDTYPGMVIMACGHLIPQTGSRRVPYPRWEATTGKVSIGLDLYTCICLGTGTRSYLLSVLQRGCGNVPMPWTRSLPLCIHCSFPHTRAFPPREGSSKLCCFTNFQFESPTKTRIYPNKRTADDTGVGTLGDDDAERETSPTTPGHWQFRDTCSV